MTATPKFNTNWKPVSDHNQLPACLARPLAASEQVGKGQFSTVSASTGYARLNDGTVPWEISGGIGDISELSDVSTTAALARVRLSDRWGSGLSMGSSTDAFTDADFSVPAYLKDENTVGKLSHTSADATLVNRPLIGMVYGLDPVNSKPFVWPGPVAWEIARGAMLHNAIVVASDSFALTANTTRTEMVLKRIGKIHGKVIQVRINTAAGFTAHDTNYWTITVAKRTSTTPGTAVTLASKTLKITGGTGNLTAFAYADLTLSTTDADLGILETDAITVTCTSETTAAAITQLTVEVIAKVC